MREDLLHYIWKSQKFDKSNLVTSASEPIEVIHNGQYNTQSGPDFFNARIRIDTQEWAGNVEIHIKSSDWYVHNHQADENYDNVILHVVWEDDVAVHRKDDSKIPCLPLKGYVNDLFLKEYERLVLNKKHKFINCESDIAQVNSITWQNWQQRLFVERLEQKSHLVETLLKATKNNWEAALFLMLLKNFGLNKNGKSLQKIGHHLGFDIIKKVSGNIIQLESLFFGTAGFLNSNESVDSYYDLLKEEYHYLKHKFRIKDYFGEKPVFFGLRPSNFPTIRLSQFSNLYGKTPQLFTELMNAQDSTALYGIFQVNASDYWSTHYTFGKESPKRIKRITKSFVHLLIVNTLVPIRFSYFRHTGSDATKGLFELMESLPSEKNSIVEWFNDHGIHSQTALGSQAKIQLYTDYCQCNRCLQCQIGVQLLKGKS